MPIAESEVSTASGAGVARPRHIVEFDKVTKQPQDVTLCGEPWDRLNPGHNGAICQACVDEQKRRPKW